MALITNQCVQIEGIQAKHEACMHIRCLELLFFFYFKCYHSHNHISLSCFLIAIDESTMPSNTLNTWFYCDFTIVVLLWSIRICRTQYFEPELWARDAVIHHHLRRRRCRHHNNNNGKYFASSTFLQDFLFLFGSPFKPLIKFTDT